MPVGGLYGDLGVQQPCGADDLLHHLGGLLQLQVPRGGADEHRLVDVGVELVEVQGPVVKGRRQPEAVVDQHLLPGPVPGEHAPHLGQRHVGLVHEQQEVVGEVVQQRKGRAARLPAGEHPGVVLNALAEANLLEHLHVVAGALLNALGLDELALAFKVVHPLLHLPLDVPEGLVHLLLGHDVVGGRVDGDVLQLGDGVPCQGVKLRQAVYLVPEELHPHGPIGGVGGENLHHVPPHAELVADEVHVIALVLQLHQLF